VAFLAGGLRVPVAFLAGGLRVPVAALELGGWPARPLALGRSSS
jgi:hypothetical protein